MMRTQSNLSQGAELDVYLVLDDFGERLGCAWRETDQADTGRANLLRGLLVFRPGNSLTKSREFLENGVSSSGPDEGL
jgi:hypothetical protein